MSKDTCEKSGVRSKYSDEKYYVYSDEGLGNCTTLVSALKACEGNSSGEPLDPLADRCFEGYSATCSTGRFDTHYNYNGSRLRMNHKESFEGFYKINEADISPVDASTASCHVRVFVDHYTPDSFSPSDTVASTVENLSGYELDQAFIFGPFISRLLVGAPYKVRVALDNKGQTPQLSDLRPELESGSMLSEEKDALLDAAAIINNNAGQDLVEVIESTGLRASDVSLHWDRRSQVRISRVNGEKAAGVAFPLTVSPLLPRTMGIHCTATTPDINSASYRNCVHTAVHEMMHLFGLGDLTTSFDPATRFFAKMDKACLEQKTQDLTSSAEASIMYYYGGYDPEQHCSEAFFRGDSVDKIELGALDKRFLQRVIERSNTPHFGDFAQGLLSGTIGALRNSVVHRVSYALLDSGCCDSLWKKVGIVKSKHAVDQAANALTALTSFAFVFSTLGVLPTIASEVTRHTAIAVGQKLKCEMDKRGYSNACSDFIITKFFPAFSSGLGLGMSSLAFQRPAVAAVQSLGAILGGSMVYACAPLSPHKHYEPLREVVVVPNSELDGQAAGQQEINLFPAPRTRRVAPAENPHVTVNIAPPSRTRRVAPADNVPVNVAARGGDAEGRFLVSRGRRPDMLAPTDGGPRLR